MTKTLVLAMLVFIGLTAAARAEQDSRTLYALHCMGCHQRHGEGHGTVPELRGFVGNFLKVPGGREFLVQVPGVAQSGLTDDEINSLTEMGLLVPDGIDEDRILDLYYNQIRFKNSTLNIVLLTTLNCNFSCSYCYEGELTYGKRMMSLETAEAALEWIKGRALENRSSRINIQYHGGEPLMNIPVIEKVGKGVKEFCSQKRTVEVFWDRIAGPFLQR